MKIRRDPLDILFSEYIRRRANGRCERCGAFKEWRSLQCSHFHGRANKSVRWDEDNAAGLCFGCHQFFTSHPWEHGAWFYERLGEKKFDLLLLHKFNTHPRPDRKKIEFELTLKLRELDD